MLLGRGWHSLDEKVQATAILDLSTKAVLLGREWHSLDEKVVILPSTTGSVTSCIVVAE